MSISTETSSTNGKGTLRLEGQKAPKPSSLERRQRLPWILGGVLLVVGCALAFGVASLRTAGGENVLAVTRSLAAGHVIEPGDLQVVKIPPTAGLTPVLASSESNSVGRMAAVRLEPGALLTPDDLGTPPAGPAGYDVVAVALKAGAYPPSLGSEDTVEAVPVAGDTSSAPNSVAGHLNPVRAVVLAVDSAPAGSDADVVVSLQVAPSNATELATLAAAGEVALVELPSGSGS